MVVGYLALELLSPREAAKRGLDEIGRFAAEFSFSKDQFVPMALAELARLAEIQRATLVGEPVRRIIPDLPLGAEIVDPSSGRWETRAEGFIIDSGSYFLCNYCGHQGRCSQDAGITANVEGDHE
jgi:hypothetical protein